MMHTLHEALRRYDEGVRAGLELHNQKTVSLLVTACSLPGSLWTDEQLPRALGLFERTWSAEPIDPRARLDRRPDSVQVRDGSEPHGDAAAPASLPPVLPRCSHPGCGEVASYGSAVTGFCRSCARHRDPSEVRVELDNMALNVLSESCVRRGGMLEYGAPRTRCTCTHARAACPASLPRPAHAAHTPHAEHKGRACGAGARLLQYQLERPSPRGGPFDWAHGSDADHALQARARLLAIPHPHPNPNPNPNPNSNPNPNPNPNMLREPAAGARGRGHLRQHRTAPPGRGCGRGCGRRAWWAAAPGQRRAGGRLRVRLRPAVRRACERAGALQAPHVARRPLRALAARRERRARARRAGSGPAGAG